MRCSEHRVSDNCHMQFIAYKSSIAFLCNLTFPNCSIFFSIEYLLENLDWLEMQTKILTSKNYINYFLFDLPGQIELFTHHESLRKMVRKFFK